MGILDRLRRPNVEVHVHARASELVMGLTPDELYRTQPNLQAVVSFLARNVAQLPLKAYTAGPDGRVRDREGTVPLLLGQPGGGLTTFELVYGTVEQIKLHGEALWVVAPSADTASGWQIRPIPHAWIADRLTYDGFEPSAYVVRNPVTGARPVPFPASSCVRFVVRDPERPMDPLTPVESLKQVLAEQASAWQYRNAVWRNGGWFSRWIERPVDAPDWRDGGRDRFARSWKARFAGRDGTDTGGTPILEDGMKLHDTTLSARESEWAEATRLGRQDVSAAFHVNPSQVWANDGQTYASVKENARQLYVDTLGPDLRLICDVLNAQLLPMVGAPAGEYVEFDIQAKLSGSFEEQAQQLQSSVGAPYMTRNEARDRMNLPRIEGGDDLVTPLNVVIGGLASPNDTDPTKVTYAIAPATKAAPDEFADLDEPDDGPEPPKARKARGHAEAEDAEAIGAALRAFCERQRRKVLPAIERARAKGRKDDPSAWWDKERWDRELAAELVPVLGEAVFHAALRCLADLGVTPEGFSRERFKSYVLTMARIKASAWNDVTYEQLWAAINGELPDTAQGSTPEGVYEKAVASRAGTAAISFATSAFGFGVHEAVEQQVPRAERVKATKTWVVTSGNPRPSHASMNGETVPFYEKFSNGADWPGDTKSLTANEVCGCRCELEITLP